MQNLDEKNSKSIKYINKIKKETKNKKEEGKKKQNL